MAKLGAFTFVLHSHLPYCRRAGRWPHGEEWLHEAAVETYLPLLNALYDLYGNNVPAHLTLGLTPILTEQLADLLVQEHLMLYTRSYVSGSVEGLTKPPVAVIGRNNRTGMQVWSADWGYLGDGDYRCFVERQGHTE
jgi:1,4-alpha-glucan branching enzyme